MSDEIIVKVKQNMGISNPEVNQPIVDPILKNFFNLNESEITNKDRSKLSEIEDFLSDIDDEMERVITLKDMRFRLGNPQLGTKELDHFHRYVRIRNSMKAKEAELRAMER